MRSWWMAGRSFSASSRGTLTRTVSPLASELMTRTCNQRSLDGEAVDWLELAGAAVACAKVPSGDRRRRAVATSAALAKRTLSRVSMTGHLLTGAAPALGDRYEGDRHT